MTARAPYRFDPQSWVVVPRVLTDADVHALDEGLDANLERRREDEATTEGRPLRSTGAVARLSRSSFLEGPRRWWAFRDQIVPRLIPYV